MIVNTNRQDYSPMRSQLKWPGGGLSVRARQCTAIFQVTLSHLSRHQVRKSYRGCYCRCWQAASVCWAECAGLRYRIRGNMPTSVADDPVCLASGTAVSTKLRQHPVLIRILAVAFSHQRCTARHLVASSSGWPQLRERMFCASLERNDWSIPSGLVGADSSVRHFQHLTGSRTFWLHAHVAARWMSAQGGESLRSARSHYNAEQSPRFHAK